MTTAEATERTLITVGDPDAPFPVPQDFAFGSNEFAEHERLKEIGDALWEKRFSHLSDHHEVAIEFLWKVKGGASGGKATLGKCVKLSGEARYFSKNADYVVWLAADHARAMEMTCYQVEALVFHELCHIDIVDDPESDKDAQFKTRGHDFEGFYAELETYGAWDRTLGKMKRSAQAALPFEDIAPPAQTLAMYDTEELAGFSVTVTKTPVSEDDDLPDLEPPVEA